MENDRLVKFLEFESTNSFDYKIDNVLIWKYMREYVYDCYIHKFFNTESRVPSFSKIKFHIFFVGQIYKIFLFDNKLLQKDILFLSFPRRIKIDGRYCCPQLDCLIEKFKFNCFILENPFWIEDKSYLKSHFLKKEKNMLYTDRIEIMHNIRFAILWLIKRRKFRRKFYKSILDFVIQINRSLELHINQEDFFKKVFWYVSFEKYAYNYYKRILKEINPKCLIEVYTPNHHIALLNTVAHDLKVPIIDIQHGAIGDFEPIMYSYYKKRQYSHLSDFIFTFGEYWKRKDNFHIDKSHVIPVGIPFLEKELNKNTLEMNKNTIVIISQARYSKMFYNLALALQKDSDISSKNKILLKLHPYEYSLYKQGYYKNLEKQGVQVDAGLQKHIYSYFKIAYCVVGVNSTALYEALAFHIPIYIYSYKYGTENLMQLSKDILTIHLFDNDKTLAEKIKNADDNRIYSYDISNIFSNNAMERSLKAINQICERKSSEPDLSR